MYILNYSKEKYLLTVPMYDYKSACSKRVIARQAEGNIFMRKRQQYPTMPIPIQQDHTFWRQFSH